MSRAEKIIVLVLVGAGMVGLYWRVVAGLPRVWLVDPTYSHGFVVPLVSAWIIWRRRRQWRKCAGEGSWWGVAMVGVAMALAVLGRWAGELFIQRGSMILALWAVVWALWGWAAARAVAFGIFFLGFMIPLPHVVYDTVAFPLRLVAAQLAGWILELVGVPVYVEGNVVHLPHVVLNVVDACSGIRTMIALAAAGALLSWLELRRWWGWLVMGVGVVVLAVVTNALRVAVSGALGEVWGSGWVEGAAHEAVGWVVFMVGFGLLWILAGWLRRVEGGR